MRKFANLFAILSMSIPCAAATIIVNWDGDGDDDYNFWVTP